MSKYFTKLIIIFELCLMLPFQSHLEAQDRRPDYPRVNASLQYEGKCGAYFKRSRQIRDIRKTIECKVNFVIHSSRAKNRIRPLYPNYGWKYSIALVKHEYSANKFTIITKGETNDDGRGTFQVTLKPTSKDRFYKFEIYGAALPGFQIPIVNTPTPVNTPNPAAALPVCAIDGYGDLRSYSSTVEAESNGARVMYFGKCLYYNHFCTQEYLPVCGIGLDNNYYEYSNKCIAILNEAKHIVPIDGSPCEVTINFN